MAVIDAKVGIYISDKQSSAIPKLSGPTFKNPFRYQTAVPVIAQYTDCGEWHPGLASWVQAFGSIAAIGIAIWVAASQRKAQLKMTEKMARDKLEALIAVVESASVFITVIGVLVEKKPPVFVFKENWKLVNKNWLESSIHSLSQLPAHEFGRGDLVRGYFGIMAGITEIRRLIDGAVGADALEEQEFVFMCQEVLNQVRIVQATWRSFQACARSR